MRCPHCLKPFSKPLPNLHFKTDGRFSYNTLCNIRVPPNGLTEDPQKVDCGTCLKRIASKANEKTDHV